MMGASVLTLLLLGPLVALEGGLVFKVSKGLRQSRVGSLNCSKERAPRHLEIAARGLLLLAVVGVLIGAAVAAPFLITAPLVIAAMLLRLGIAQLALVHIRQRALLRYMKALEHPKIARARMALYFSEPRLPRPYQVTMWLQPLLALNEPFVILLKERKHLRHFPKSDLYEVLLVSDLPQRFGFLPASVELLFFVNNSMVNLSVMAANPKVTHVQLLHGDSDKPPSYNPMSGVYDRLFVAGEMAIDRYARHGVRIARDKFRIVGRPQISSPVQSFRSVQERKTIVYMTTWAGMFEDSNFCSLPQADDMLRQVVGAGIEADVIFKPHPLSLRDPAWPEIEGRIQQVIARCPPGVTLRIADPGEDPFGLYEQADVLISDMSSTVIDFLATAKPYIITGANALEAGALAKFPSVSGGYLAAQDGANLAALITQCFADDPLAARRDSLRAYAFGDWGLPAGAAFRAACAEILEPPAPMRTEARADQRSDAA